MLATKSIDKKTFPVRGMSCVGCASSVEKRLRNEEGVKEASVNFSNHTVYLVFDPKVTTAERLQKSLSDVGYDLKIEADENQLKKEQEAEYKSLRNQLLVAFLFTLPVFLLSMVITGVPYANWIMLVLSLPVIFYSGKDFYISAWKKIQHGTTNMDTLIALGTGVAFLFSTFNTIYPEFLRARGMEPHVYFESAVVIITLILLGNLLEARAKASTSSAIEKLMGLQAKKARLIRDGEEEMVPVEEVKPGDILMIRPGEKIPVDGEVTEGFSYVDESMVTGEPEAAAKEKGTQVVGGTLNKAGNFRMKATKVGSETMLARIIQMVQEAQGSKANAQKLADKIASVFVPVVVGIALLSAGIWYFAGPEPAFTNALVILVTVLIIACPCALGLATPTAITVGIGKAAEKGILIRDAQALERVSQLDVVVVDKTGTITKGKPEVTDLIFDSAVDEQEKFKALIREIESKSEHPLAEAVSEYLSDNRQDMTLDHFEAIQGKGVKAVYNSQTYHIGSLSFLKEIGAQMSSTISTSVDKLKAEGKTLAGFTEENKVIALIALSDTVKEDAPEMVKRLQKDGIRVIMATGDHEASAEKVARKVGVDQYHAGVLPENKADLVKKLQAEGLKVAMAGDGINDAPALAQADVGIAMATGTDIAMESADITLLKGELDKIEEAIRISQKTSRTIKENLFWAFIYNIICIPIAAGVLYPVNGFLLNPMIAGGAMAFSSLSVVLNSLRLKVSK